jgi:hypothetical protein
MQEVVLRFFDISQAFLHTPIRANVLLEPQREYWAYCLPSYNTDPGDVVW